MTLPLCSICSALPFSKRTTARRQLQMLRGSYEAFNTSTLDKARPLGDCLPIPEKPLTDSHFDHISGFLQVSIIITIETCTCPSNTTSSARYARIYDVVLSGSLISSPLNRRRFSELAVQETLNRRCCEQHRIAIKEKQNVRVKRRT